MPLRTSYKVRVKIEPGTKKGDLYTLRERMHDIAWNLGGDLMEETKTHLVFELSSIRAATRFRAAIRRDCNVSFYRIKIVGAYEKPYKTD